MFAFGLLMVALLWGYWDRYTGPFRSLQYAIADRFPGSSPRVIGGQHKSHKGDSPVTLRIVVRIHDDEFNPETDLTLSEERALALVRMAAEHQRLEDYDVLDVHLIQRVPEQETRHWTVSREVGVWRGMLADR